MDYSNATHYSTVRSLQQVWCDYSTLYKRLNMITGSGAEAKASWRCVFWEGRVLLTAWGWTWFMMEMLEIQIKEQKWNQGLKRSSITELPFISLFPQIGSCSFFFLIKKEFLEFFLADPIRSDHGVKWSNGKIRSKLIRSLSDYPETVRSFHEGADRSSKDHTTRSDHCTVRSKYDDPVRPDNSGTFKPNHTQTCNQTWAWSNNQIQSTSSWDRWDCLLVRILFVNPESVAEAPWAGAEKCLLLAF